ncbi:winged helix-turn-helix domain-containing protein [Blastomonas sp.]|uniref:winged helix-turn-helix domain-containing protein n=1 Tax=Blastomonas sp. TaxID=1909299 RepID=UPI00263980FD|nr:LysR family transcriptional regulator [Blastomonas sp.]MDM7957106.1 LysR family transcriptional regulator [Blastomonas sp.]
MTSAPPSRLKIKAQVCLEDRIAIGPGKADLLAAVEREGSIAAAGRSLGISYRRTRDMIDTLNQCWGAAVVITEKGGKSGGGSRLTDRGHEVLDAYRALEQALQQTADRHAPALLDLLGPAEQHD